MRWYLLNTSSADLPPPMLVDQLSCPLDPSTSNRSFLNLDCGPSRIGSFFVEIIFQDLQQYTHSKIAITYMNPFVFTLNTRNPRQFLGTAYCNFPSDYVLHSVLLLLSASEFSLLATVRCKGLPLCCAASTADHPPLPP